MKVIPKWIGLGPVYYEMELENTECDSPHLLENFRPLAFLCKISLVLPIKNILKPDSSLSFKLASFEVISAMLLNPCIGYILVSKIHYDDDFKPNIIREAAAYLVSNTFFMFGQQTFLSLIEKIDRFDFSLSFCSKLCYFKSVSKYVWVLIPCIYPVVLVSVVGFSLYNGESCTQYRCPLMELVRGFFRYQHHLQITIFMFFCYEIKLRFKTLNVAFYDFVKTSYLCKNVTLSNHSQLENYRLQYAWLIQCTKTLNDVFGWRFVFMFAVIILNAIWLLYFYYTEEGYVITGFDVLTQIFNFALLLILTHNTDLMVKESQRIDGYLMEIPTQDLDWATTFQLDHTFHQCEMFQVHMSASGMVSVEKSLLLGMAGAITMYYIAILQMTTTEGSFTW
ncbi:hypothetical protein J6590_001236 [Homalodisca vitripennis]|nr:hypothetical protein J6590_001236 [Homalodisca vitripennis]